MIDEDNKEKNIGEPESESQSDRASEENPGRVRGSVDSLFVKKTNKLSTQFFRYLFVGATTTVIDVVILNLLISVFDTSSFVAATVGYIAGIIANYFLCIWWIFKSDPSKRKFEFIGSMCIGLLGLVLNDIIVVYGADLLPKLDFLASISGYKEFTEAIPNYYVNVAKGIATVVVLAWNFLGRKYLIFRSK